MLKWNLVGRRDPSWEEIKAAHIECTMGRDTECVVQVGEEDFDVVNDERQADSKCGDGESERLSGCGLDPFEITQLISQRCWKERGLRSYLLVLREEGPLNVQSCISLVASTVVVRFLGASFSRRSMKERSRSEGRLSRHEEDRRGYQGEHIPREQRHEVGVRGVEWCIRVDDGAPTKLGGKLSSRSDWSRQ